MKLSSHGCKRALSAWVVAAAFGTARADIIYGLNGGGAGGIYKIDTTTKLATLYRSTPLGLAKGNGLAYDQANDTFYYVMKPGSGANVIVRNSPGSVETNLGTMATHSIINSGTFYNGMYWVQPNNAPGVIRVTPLVSSFLEVPTTIPGYPTNVGYGDIASDASGMTWASHSSGMRRYNLNALSAGSVALVGPSPPGRQLAFGPSGLWGVSGLSLVLFNTSTGTVASHGSLIAPGLGFVDLASAPTPGAGVAMAMAGVWAGRRRRRGRAGA